MKKQTNTNNKCQKENKKKKIAEEYQKGINYIGGVDEVGRGPKKRFIISESFLRRHSFFNSSCFSSTSSKFKTINSNSL